MKFYFETEVFPHEFLVYQLPLPQKSAQPQRTSNCLG
eukprot:SAG11_NODE_30205_length_303_cov_0.754902_1_plen_36_part_01